MRILFDQGTPVPLRTFLSRHTVVTSFEVGWSNLSNGDLIAKAEVEVDLLTSTDQSLKYQQNLKGRRLAILVLMTANWPKLREKAEQIASIVNEMREGDYREFEVERE